MLIFKELLFLLIISIFHLKIINSCIKLSIHFLFINFINISTQNLLSVFTAHHKFILQFLFPLLCHLSFLQLLFLPFISSRMVSLFSFHQLYNDLTRILLQCLILIISFILLYSKPIDIRCNQYLYFSIIVFLNFTIIIHQDF